MMRWEARCALLTLLALAFATSRLLAAAAPAKTPPRLSREQATQQAAAFARAFDVPVIKASRARLSGSTWVLRSGLSTVVIRDDTGQLLELGRGERPGPGAKPVTKEQAIASATHLLKVAGAPADVKLGEPEWNDLRWSFRCQRQTPQGVPYYDGRVSIVIDAAGHVETARLYWSPSPRISAKQAKEKAAAFAKAAGLPWDDTATPTLMYTGDPRDQTGPTQWEVRCRGARLFLRGDTGAVHLFHRPVATRPEPGKRPPTEEEAVAAAARVLRLLGAAPNAPPAATKTSDGGWHLAWERRTPDGVFYYADTTSASVDATGQVVSAWVNWHHRPPASTKARVSKRRAAKLAVDAARKLGLLGTDQRKVTARLEIVPARGFESELSNQQDVPTRLAWVVSIVRPAARRERVVAIDAADGKALGTYSVLWVASAEQRAHTRAVRLAAWVALGPLVAALVAAAAYLARRREEKAAEEQEE
jgi:hypothetical protein